MENGVVSVYTGLSGFLNPVMSEKDNPPRLDRVERPDGGSGAKR